jgi:hypothetical protein
VQVHSPVAAQHGLAQSLLECYMKAAERDADSRAKTRPKSLENAQPPAQLDILRRLLPREGDSSTGVNEPLTDDGAEAECSHQTHVVKLVHNYRSHRKLLELPSRMFYKDELVATAEVRSAAAWSPRSCLGFEPRGVPLTPQPWFKKNPFLLVRGPSAQAS